MPQYRPYNVYAPAKPVVRTAPKRRLSLKSALWLSVLVFIFIIGFKIDLAQRANARAALAAETARRTAAIGGLNDKLSVIAKDHPGISFGISATDSKLNMPTSYGGYSVNDAASTGKLLTAAFYLNRVEKGQLNASQKIDGYSSTQALQLLIQQSNDEIWTVLNDQLGHGGLQTYASDLNLNSYDAERNSLSADDMTSFIKQLDSGALLNDTHTAELKKFMQHTNYEDFITPAVGKSFQLFHKVGVVDDQVNDTAIIKGDSDTLYLTVFTNGHGIYDWSSRAKIIQQITSQVEQAYLD